MTVTAPQLQFDETIYVRSYEYARRGKSPRQIAHSLGVSIVQFCEWMDEHPALDDAIQRGKDECDSRPLEEKLTVREKLLVKEWLKDFNITRAATRSGYAISDNNPNNQSVSYAHTVMRKPHVQAFVSKELQRLFSRHDVSIDRVLEELCRLAFYDIGDLEDGRGEPRKLKDIPQETRRAISGYEHIRTYTEDGDLRVIRKFRLQGKEKALEMLGKYLKMFVEKVEVQHTGDVFVKLLGQVEAGRLKPKIIDTDVIEARAKVLVEENNGNS